MDQSTRRIIGFAVHAGYVDGIALCCMFNTAIARMGVPKHPSSDNDPLFACQRWLANLRILEIDEVKTVPYTPVSHPFVERLIGSLRRESYGVSNSISTIHEHNPSLDGDTPAETTGSVVTHPAAPSNFTWEKHCGGLFELPVAA